MARLREEYNNTIREEMMKEFGYTNIMEVPTLKKSFSMLVQVTLLKRVKL